jgi:hypothetical protein
MIDKSDSADVDLDSSDRISLLLEWWAQSELDEFAAAALSVALHPPRRFTPWRDGSRLLTMISELHDSGHHEPGPRTDELIHALDQVAVELFENYMGSDDLLKMSDIVEDGRVYSAELCAASHAAIVREFENAEEVASGYTSESELDEHAEALRQLAPRALIPESAITRALEYVDMRLGEVQSSTTNSSDPNPFERDSPNDKSFDDDALNNLFDSLR